MSDACAANRTAQHSLTSVRLVAMTVEHVRALLPYERDLFGPEAWTRAGYLAELADRRHRSYVAAEDEHGALLGWAGVRVVADEAEILTIGVVPHARRRHVGLALLHALLDAARERGAGQVFLEVRVDNAPARALYVREGFAEIGIRRGYYDAGRIDAVVMSRAVPSRAAVAP